MVKRANDPSGQEDHGGEERRSGCRRHCQELQAGEQKGNHDGREYLEKALNPEVHHPPPPVFRGDQMALLPIHEPGRIEQRNGDTGDEKEYEQRLVLGTTCQCRSKRTEHEPKTEEETEKKKYLPETTENNIL